METISNLSFNAALCAIARFSCLPAFLNACTQLEAYKELSLPFLLVLNLVQL